MKRIIPALAALVLSGTISAQDKLAGMSDEFMAVARTVVPVVVSITVTRKAETAESEHFRDNVPFGPPGGEREKPSLGSGVIVDKRGYIVTNHHVVENALSIRITTSAGVKYTASVLGTDPATDLALLKIDDPLKADMPVIAFADSSSLKQGQIVFAVGNAFGFADTVTMGIVSAVHREGLGLADYENLIQTDAAINPGNSGGALVDVKGRLVGVNNAIYTRTGGYMGVGFAIPSNTVRSVIDQLIRGGKVVRGWLGVSVQALDEDLAEKTGVREGGAIVAEVLKNSPAEAAGFVEGDIILAINNIPAKSLHQVRRYIAGIVPGAVSRITVQRGAEKKTLEVKIGRLPDPAAKKQSAYAGGPGIVVKDLDEETAYQFGIRERSGVVVTEVAPGSPAERAGVLKGDLIRQLENRTIATAEDYEKVLASSGDAARLLLLIKRGGGQSFLVITMPRR